MSERSARDAARALTLRISLKIVVPGFTASRIHKIKRLRDDGSASCHWRRVAASGSPNLCVFECCYCEVRKHQPNSTGSYPGPAPCCSAGEGMIFRNLERKQYVYSLCII